MDLISELLDETHILTQFACGKEPLDRWLRTSAARGNIQDTGRTWVVHAGDGYVLGYYTLTAHALHRDNLSQKEARSLPREIPVILLAKLAIDARLKGQGYGRDLLVGVLEKCVDAGAIAASRYVVVDAIDENAAKFYEHYGFDRIPKTDRLLRRVKDIAPDLQD